MIASSRCRDIIWLVDTGASDDMIGSEVTKANGLEVIKAKNPSNFNTAGGTIKVDKQVKVVVQGIDASITPWILPGGPDLLSVGKRIEEGRSFVWPRDGNPFFINADETVVRLGTQHYIPYINCETTKSTPSRYESDIITAIDEWRKAQHGDKVRTEVIVPVVDNNEESMSQENAQDSQVEQDSSESSDEEEEPL